MMEMSGSLLKTLAENAFGDVQIHARGAAVQKDHKLVARHRFFNTVVDEILSGFAKLLA